jgi:uncharacterized protein YaiI (UPF0178 family)
VTTLFVDADGWTVEHVEPGDITVTADIPLATRKLMACLRDMGAVSGGPAPCEKRGRSRFLQFLSGLIQASLKGARWISTAAPPGAGSWPGRRNWHCGG